MKYIVIILGFFMSLDFAFAKPSSYSSVTESCDQSTRGPHTVSENSYQRLLARLGGKTSKDKKKKKKGRRGTGQR